MLPLRGDGGADWRPVSPALARVRRVSTSAVLLPVALALGVAAALLWLNADESDPAHAAVLAFFFFTRLPYDRIAFIAEMEELPLPASVPAPLARRMECETAGVGV